MSILLTELVESRSQSGGTTTRKYVLAGTASDITAREQLLAAVPLWDGNLQREPNPRIDPRWVDETTDDGQWDCQVRYSPRFRVWPQTGESRFSFSTSGGTAHITQAIANVASYAPSLWYAPVSGGAIEVGDDGPQGIDIQVPIYRFSETHFISDTLVTDAYKGALFRLTGKVNDAPFRGLAPGECLFGGAEGAMRETEDDWEIRFDFAGSPNLTNITIGQGVDVITGINKKGWEHLWVRYRRKKDPLANWFIWVPLAAYVDQVYYYGSYADLLI